MNIKIKILTIIIAGIIQACAPSKNIQVISSVRPPLSENCRVEVYIPRDNKPEKYKILATVNFDDAGFSVSCSQEIIREKMRIEACKVGANAIIITKEYTPGLMSTCYLVTAELVHITK